MRLARVETVGLLAIVLAGLSTQVVACGGSDTKVEYPKAVDGGIAPGPVTAGTATVGISEGAHGDGSGLSGSARSAYEKGWQAWLAGDLNTAKASFREAANADPRSPAPQYSLGTVLERLGDKAGAQMAFRTAFSIKPDHEPSICAYALSLARGKSPGEADTFISDKAARNPTSARITTCHAEVKSIANDSGTAQKLAQDALRMNPDYKEAMVVIARDHYRARRLDLAKYALQAILDGFGEGSPARDKNNAEAMLLRGVIAREQGNRAVAMASFDAARAKRPDLVEAVIQTGAMKLEAGNVAEATPMLESAVRYAPNSALAHLNLGDAYRLSNRPADAKKEFDAALSLDSTLAVAHYDLGLMYLFSDAVPGMSPDAQVAQAIRELETYKNMRGGAKQVSGEQKDDVDELLSRAKQKQNELKQPQVSVAPTPAAAPPAGGKDAGAAAPAAGGKDGGAAAAPAAGADGGTKLK